MSLSRSIFHELRPFFRLFDDVARSTRAPFPVMHRSFSPFFDDFVPQSRQPALDLSEQGNDYIVEAEIPGVKKENLEVRVGDNGRSLTIEGKILSRSHRNGDGNGASGAVESGSAAANGDGNASAAQEVTKADSPTAISSEREFVGSTQFTGTVWLPRAVDPSKVNATLQDGILTLRIPKLTEEQGSVKVQIQ